MEYGLTEEEQRDFARRFLERQAEKIARLPELQRRVVEFVRENEGRDATEIAGALGVPVVDVEDATANLWRDYWLEIQYRNERRNGTSIAWQYRGGSMILSADEIKETLEETKTPEPLSTNLLTMEWSDARGKKYFSAVPSPAR